jgi:hypothetical protein
MSILLSCVLYTLEDKNVKENKYIHIFISWLAHVFKYADLNKEDKLRIIIDKDTYDHLNEVSFYSLIIKLLDCEKEFIFIARPKTHAEGMMSRFIEKEYTQTSYMYCDIDILIKNPLRGLTSIIAENTLAVHVEGTMVESCYNMLFPDDWILEKGAQHSGFSSGKFIINGHELYKYFFNLVNTTSKNQPIDDFYAPDQCVYNYAVYSMPRETYNVDMTTIKAPIISINGSDECPDKTIMIDMMGEPGNGDLHFIKIFESLLEHFLTN